MPMKICPLRACMQSSFSSTSPIPSSGGIRHRARPGHGPGRTPRNRQIAGGSPGPRMQTPCPNQQAHGSQGTTHAATHMHNQDIEKPTDTGEKTRKGTHQSGDNPWSRARGRAPPSAMASVHGLWGHETPEGCVFGGVGRGGWSSESLCSSRLCDPVLCLTQIRLMLYTRYCFITFKESTSLSVIPLERHNEPVSRADKAPGYR